VYHSARGSREQISAGGSSYIPMAQRRRQSVSCRYALASAASRCLHQHAIFLHEQRLISRWVWEGLIFLSNSSRWLSCCRFSPTSADFSVAESNTTHTHRSGERTMCAYCVSVRVHAGPSRWDCYDRAGNNFPRYLVLLMSLYPLTMLNVFLLNFSLLTKCDPEQ
jgi:hypothetical protein